MIGTSRARRWSGGARSWRRAWRAIEPARHGRPAGADGGACGEDGASQGEAGEAERGDGARWEHEHLLEAVQQRLDANPQAMRQRRETVEHPFGTMKARMGATHFLTKTLPKVAAEMALSVRAYLLHPAQLNSVAHACAGKRSVIRASRSSSCTQSQTIMMFETPHLGRALRSNIVGRRHCPWGHARRKQASTGQAPLFVPQSGLLWQPEACHR